MTDERQMPDWLPQGSAWSLPEGTRSFGSTGQLFEVKGRRWVRVPPDVVPIYRPPHGDMTRAGVVAMIVCLVAALLALWVVHASARDLDGRYAQAQSIAVIATICLGLSCQDVVVTTSEQDSSVTVMWCAIGGQVAISKWLADNKPGYRLAGWQCIDGARRRGV